MMLRTIRHVSHHNGTDNTLRGRPGTSSGVTEPLADLTPNAR